MFSFGNHVSFLLLSLHLLKRISRKYKKACDGGYNGMFQSWCSMQNGQGVTRSHAEAAEVYKKACDGGHARGCSNLGYLYENGRGVPQSSSKAKDFAKNPAKWVMKRHVTSRKSVGTSMSKNRVIGSALNGPGNLAVLEFRDVSRLLLYVWLFDERLLNTRRQY